MEETKEWSTTGGWLLAGVAGEKSQSLWSAFTYIKSMYANVWFKRSTSSFAWGWYAVVVW
jgi:hypothetical protein